MGDLHAFLSHLFQEFFREMKAGGWRRRRPVVLRVNSLVPVFILQFMGNIRRKRHFSKLIQDFFKNTVILKPDQAVAFIYNIQDLSLQDPVSKSDPGSWSRFLPGFTRHSQVSFSFRFRSRISIRAPVSSLCP